MLPPDGGSIFSVSKKPLPLPLGEVAERSEDGENHLSHADA